MHGDWQTFRAPCNHSQKLLTGMDSKTFISRLARLMDCDTKCATDMVTAFASVIREKAADLDTVTVPGFGNFVAIKKAERIETDPATGRQMLMPPQITIEFVAGRALKKRLSNEQNVE